MEKESIVVRLVAGSKAINQMRSEIKLVTQTVMSLVRTDDLQDLERVQGPHISIPLGGEGALSWFYLAGPGEINPSDYLQLVACKEETPTGQTIILTVRGDAEIKSQDVRKVHRTLDCFVKGMVQTFPGLLGRLQFLLDAASK